MKFISQSAKALLAMLAFFLVSVALVGAVVFWAWNAAYAHVPTSPQAAEPPPGNALDPARPIRSPYCVLGFDFDRDGAVGINDFSRGIGLLYRSYGKTVVNCPPLPAPHVICTLADAAGRFCCRTFDPEVDYDPFIPGEPCE